MKHFSFLFFWLSSIALFSQNIVWEKAFKKDRFNDFNCIRSTPDGGCLCGVNVTPYKEEAIIRNTSKEINDFIWLLKLDSNGKTEWEKNLGDSANNYLMDIQTTLDHGFILLSAKSIVYKTTSNDIIGLEPKTLSNICISKMDSTGTIEWEKSYSVSWNDMNIVLQTSDGGYLFGGRTFVYDKNKAPKTFKSIQERIEYLEQKQGIVVYKVDSKGAIQWKKIYGGTKNDYLKCMCQMLDGGYLLGGETYSYDLDINNKKEGRINDFIIKINSKGKVLSEKTVGDSISSRIWDIKPCLDGGYLIGGQKSLPGRQKSDFWVLKTDSEIHVQWEKYYGGSDMDALKNILSASDSSFVLFGVSSSTDGDIKSDNKGSADLWLVKINGRGDILWEKTFGGSKFDGLLSNAQIASDGGYYLGGSTESSDGDLKSETKGGKKIWIVKVKE